MRVWPLGTPANPLVLAQPDYVHDGALSPNGRTFATCLDQGEVLIWSTENPRVINRLKHEGAVGSLAYSRDGRMVASCPLSDTQVKLWDIASGELLHVFPHDRLVYSVAFSPDGAALACAVAYGTVTVWDLTTKEPTQLTNVASSTLSYSPDGSVLACGAYDIGAGGIVHSAKLWDFETEQVTHTFPGFRARGILRVAFSRDGARLAVGVTTGIITVWDVINETKIVTLAGRGGETWPGNSSLLFSPNGGQLLSAELRSITFWDVTTGKLQFELKAHDQDITFLAMTPDGKTLITGSADSTVKLWRAATFVEIQEMRERWRNRHRSLSSTGREKHPSGMPDA